MLECYFDFILVLKIMCLTKILRSLDVFNAGNLKISVRMLDFILVLQLMCSLEKLNVNFQCWKYKSLFEG